MPFVRYARDKRGYEQIWLVHAPVRRGRPSRARVLYWYRSPPGVRVGREPFDPALRATLEAQYPDVRFDWDQLSAAAVIPPIETEPWRERRRAQRDARRSRADVEDERTAVGVPPEEATEASAPVRGDDDQPDSTLTAADGPSAVLDEGRGGEVVQPNASDARRRRRNRRRRPRGPEGAAGEVTRRPSESPAEEPAQDPTDRPFPSSDS